MTRIIVDTNVVSECMKKMPTPHVMEWMEAHEDELFLTSITIEELRFGEFMMPKGKRRRALGSLIDTLIESYASRILGFDAAAAHECARFHEQAIAQGRTPTIEDMMIAGIARSQNAVLATRNTRDFDFLDIQLTNPFDR